MVIKIICVGKIKEQYFAQAIAEYQKRLQRYCKIEVCQVIDEQTPDKAPPAVEEEVRRREGERILKKIREDEYVISLEIQGKMLDSVELAHHLEELGNRGKSRIDFVIGGSLGLHESVCKRADFALSFSKMTFPHQMMRMILLEQIYRAYRINSHEPYHK